MRSTLQLLTAATASLNDPERGYSPEQCDTLARAIVRKAYGTECGIESVELRTGSVNRFVVRADVYGATLCQVDGGRWQESSPGDIAEAHARAAADCQAFCDGAAMAAVWADCMTEDGEPAGLCGSEFSDDVNRLVVRAGDVVDLLTVAAREALDTDASQFFYEQRPALQAVAQSDRQPSYEELGHDFHLSRNGHGIGFWDRGYGQTGLDLHKASKTYGSVSLTYDGEEIHVGG